MANLSGQKWDLGYLLDLDGAIGEIGHGFFYKIEATQVPVTPGRPHGLKYSLTLHDPTMRRIFGIDNAHGLSGRRGKGQMRIAAFDHIHQGRKMKVYEYTTAEALMLDFWDAIDREFKKRGMTL